MSKVQEIQTIRKALEHHLSQIDGLCSCFSTSENQSIEKIQEMHDRLLTKCEDILKQLRGQYPNSMVLIEQIKRMAKSAEQVYPFEHVYGDDRVLPIKQLDFWHKYINDGDIFKKRKSFFAFKADLLMLLSEYAKSDYLITKNGTVVTADPAKLNPTVININNSRNFIDTPLKSLFKEAAKYDAVMNLMIGKSKILQTADGLQWRGYKGNAKYEAVAFLEVLSAKGLLSNKFDSDKYKIEILSGTFLDYTCSGKTARNKQLNVARPKYDALLSSI